MVADFDDWVNERIQYFKQDDYWSEERYVKAVDDACIWEFLDDEETAEIFDEDEKILEFDSGTILGLDVVPEV